MFEKKMLMCEHEYRSMTPKVAQHYFEWFKENIPNEVYLLQLGMLEDPFARKIPLDYSPESLKTLYEWYLTMRKYKKLSKKQILEDFADAPDYIIQEMLVNRYAPTVGIVDLATKLAIYSGEVFIHNDSDLYWDYVKKPKTDESYNMPVIFGFSPPEMKFQACFNTFSMCMPTYSSSAKGEKDKRTWFEWHQHWMDNKEMYYSPIYSHEAFGKIWRELLFGPNKAKDKSDFSPKAIFKKMKEMHEN